MYPCICETLIYEEQVGYGLDYQYPHSFPGGWVAQQYLPEELKGTCYYKPTGRGHEKEIMAYLEDKKPKKRLTKINKRYII